MKYSILLLAGAAGFGLLLPLNVLAQGRHVVVHPAPPPRPAVAPRPQTPAPRPAPRVFDRSPALGVEPRVVRPAGTPVAVPRAPAVNLLAHEPHPQVIHNPVPAQVGAKFENKVEPKNWVEANHARVGGPVGAPDKAPVIERAPKGSAAVVEGFRGRLGGRDTFVAGGKTFNVRDTRRDLVDLHDREFQHHVDLRHDRGLWVRDHMPLAYHNLYAPGWWNRFGGLRLGWWGHWPNYWGDWRNGFAWGSGWNWWHACGWPGFINWCFPGYAWAPPFYYDYGPGGDCVFDQGVVYIQGQPVCSEVDYANQALQLAAQGDNAFANAPPAGPLQDNWLPFGVWALTNQTDGEPTMFFQLAVTKQGAIAGTLYNSATDDVQPVVGAVDRTTQRAAWYAGNDKSTVFETGVYNLCNPETQVLVHFGPDNSQTWLMVRTDGPPKQ